MRIHHVESNMAVHHFGHKTVERTSSGSDQLEELSARIVVPNCPLNGIDLSADPSNSVQELDLVSFNVGHPDTLPGYWTLCSIFGATSRFC